MIQNFLEFLFKPDTFPWFFFSIVLLSSPSIKIWSIQESYVKVLPEGRSNSGDESLSSKMKTKLSLFFFPRLPKIRSSITQLLWAGKEFSWWRHCSITISLLAFTNVLVIFVPTIRDIFGFIGKHFLVRSSSPLHFRKSSSSLIRVYLPVYEYLFPCFFSTGASAAAMLIFILPSAFYIKLVKKEPMKSVQKIGVCIDKYVTTIDNCITKYLLTN